MRSSRHASDSPSTRRNRMARCHRSPDTSGVRIDAEPSCRMTRSTPAVRTSAAAATGRASARIVHVLAAMRLSQKMRLPKIGNRSRTGSRRCCRNRRASRRRAVNCQPQMISSAPGATSSHRYSGCAKRTLGSPSNAMTFSSTSVASGIEKIARPSLVDGSAATSTTPNPCVMASACAVASIACCAASGQHLILLLDIPQPPATTSNTRPIFILYDFP